MEYRLCARLLLCCSGQSEVYNLGLGGGIFQYNQVRHMTRLTLKASLDSPFKLPPL
jgi:hypothetical protein